MTSRVIPRRTRPAHPRGRERHWAPAFAGATTVVRVAIQSIRTLEFSGFAGRFVGENRRRSTVRRPLQIHVRAQVSSHSRRDQKIVWRVAGFQLAAGVVVAVLWAPGGVQRMLAAFAGAALVAAATLASAWKHFGPVGEPAGRVAMRFVSATLVRWAVLIGGLYVLLGRVELSAPAVISGLIVALSGYLFALRWQ